MFVRGMTRNEFALEFKKINSKILDYERTNIYERNKTLIRKCSTRMKRLPITRRTLELNVLTMYLEGEYHFSKIKIQGYVAFTVKVAIRIYIKNVELKDGKYPLVCHAIVPFPIKDAPYKDGEDRDSITSSSTIFITHHYMERARERCRALSACDDMDLFNKIIDTDNNFVIPVHGKSSSYAIASPYGISIAEINRKYYDSDNYSLSTYLLVTFVSSDMLSAKQKEEIDRNRRILSSIKAKGDLYEAELENMRMNLKLDLSNSKQL